MKSILIEDQIVLQPVMRLSIFSRAVSFLSSLVLAIMTIAVISAVTIYFWERAFPRITIDITPAVIRKACGVAA